jgi:hypothetical protein
MPPIYASAPDDPTAEIEALRREVLAVNLIQERSKSFLEKTAAHREAAAAAEKESALKALLYAAGGPARGMEDIADHCEADDGEAEMSPDEDDAAIDADDANADPPFVIKNLDTGEQLSLQATPASPAPTLASQLTFGTIIPNSSEWDAAKAECRGRLEKLAAKSSLSFRSYQLCVWQERYVFAEDNALCYRQLNKEHVPVGKAKRIPYASMQFVGPFDDLQFVIMCPRRSYTFLTADTEERTRWIKALSALSGCSASTEVCLHTTLRRRWARDAGAPAE